MTIPDAEAAVSTITRQIDDDDAERLLELVASVPTPVWGRDELGAGEMWNSNSITAWVAEPQRPRHGDDGSAPGGRAPGWDAGLTIADVGRESSGRRSVESVSVNSAGVITQNTFTGSVPRLAQRCGSVLANAKLSPCSSRKCRSPTHSSSVPLITSPASAPSWA